MQLQHGAKGAAGKASTRRQAGRDKQAAPAARAVGFAARVARVSCRPRRLPRLAPWGPNTPSIKCGPRMCNLVENNTREGALALPAAMPGRSFAGSPDQLDAVSIGSVGGGVGRGLRCLPRSVWLHASVSRGMRAAACCLGRRGYRRVTARESWKAERSIWKSCWRTRLKKAVDRCEESG